jgi:hypothetical protein
MTLLETERRRHQSERDRAYHDDHRVLSFRQWCELNGFSRALYRDRKQQRHAALSNAKVPSFDQAFPLGYVDPPWTFEVHSDLGKLLTSPETITRR